LIEFLQHIDRSLFLYLNGMHTPLLDQVMYYASKGLLWFPLYLVFLFLVIRKYKWQALLIILFAALMITVSDQFASLSKDFFQRLRPSNEPGLNVHLVFAYKGGQYGFYSAHASNSFATAVFLIMLLNRQYRFFFIPVLLWSCFLSYTRIYLGVHYPGDTLTGIIIGSFLGFVSAKIFLMISGRWKDNRNDPEAQKRP
jgi:undecaprenyl-diphosphatase